MTISSNASVVTAPESGPVAHRAAWLCPGCYSNVPADRVPKDSCVGRCALVHEDSDACRNCREWLCVGCGKHPVDVCADALPDVLRRLSR
ncbi:hypothetical protein [Streptomyces sp. MMBL 11-1]|uniref:hypothetical protein n=1 Tax=Streptomyces sp. MMBL 11-1 TaxID=3026420 RepID=UPI00235ED8EE|nr:hypothetical protein [Streptomyces sp. MMBL 11-1]